MHRVLIACAVLCLFACSRESGSAPADLSKSSEISITSKSAEAIAHFKAGRDLSENSRAAEAAAEFEAALKLDPDFALARAFYGSVLPDADSLKQMEQANDKTSALPQPERLEIELLGP